MISNGAIVAGVDDSPEARDAALLGRSLARAASAELHLVSAVDDPLADMVAVRLRLDVDRLHRSLIRNARAAVVSNLSPAFPPEELDRRLSIRIGRPEHVLREVGRETQADLFVVGGGRGGSAGRWIRRGTAHHLLRSRDCPVLVTGPGAPDIARVVVAVDVSFAARPTIAAARGFAELLGVPLHGLHVAGHRDFPAGWDPVVNLGPVYDEMERRVADEIWPLLPDDAPREVRRGAPIPAIREAAALGGPSLLVLGAQGRGRVDRLLLGSTTEALLHLPPCSLAIVPVTPGEL